MNHHERRILSKLHRELAMRKFEHPSLYGAWWVLTELLHGRLGSAERLADLGLKVSEWSEKMRGDKEK